jgi:uncharacterized protein DUF5666
MAFRSFCLLVLCMTALALPAPVNASALEGPVTAKPSRRSGATFDVLGVPVKVDANTRLDDSYAQPGPTLEGVKVGQVLELSGQFDANGVLLATSIEVKPAAYPGQTFEIKGQVTDLRGSPPTQTFKLRGASFTTNTTTFVALRGGLVNGAVVKVKTQSTSAPFVAVRVKGQSDDDDFDHEAPHVEKARAWGLVTGLTGTFPNFSFTLDARRVTTNGATRGLARIQPNARIKAKGPLDPSGAIVASKISGDDDGDDDGDHEREHDD